MVTVLRQLGEKTSGRLRPEQCIAAGDLPQMLADGARGVNQSLLPLPRDVVGRPSVMIWFVGLQTHVAPAVDETPS